MQQLPDAREAVEPTQPAVRCVPGVDRGRTGSESTRTVAEEIALCERYQADCERHMAAGYQPVGALIGWLDLEAEKQLIEEGK